MANYSQDINQRVKLLEHHSKKPCLYGQCNRETGVPCERHLDSSAIVRRYLKMQKLSQCICCGSIGCEYSPCSKCIKCPVHHQTETTEARIEQTLGTYRHADRTEWRRRFPG